MCLWTLKLEWTKIECSQETDQPNIFSSLSLFITMTTVVIQLETYSVPDCSNSGTRSFPGLDIFIKWTLLLFSAEAKNTSDWAARAQGGLLPVLSEPRTGRTNRLMGLPINLGSTSFPRKTAPDTNIPVKIKTEFSLKGQVREPIFLSSFIAHLFHFQLPHITISKHFMDFQAPFVDAVPLPRMLFLPLPLWVHDYLLVLVQAPLHFLSPGSDWNAPWPVPPRSFCLSLSELTFCIIITSFRFVCVLDLEFLEGRNCVPLIIIPEASNSAELNRARTRVRPMRHWGDKI